MTVVDVQLHWQAASVWAIHLDIHHGLAYAQGFSHLVLGEMDGLSLLEGDEVYLEGLLFFGEREDKCFLPDEVLVLRGRLAVSLAVIVGKPTK